MRTEVRFMMIVSVLAFIVAAWGSWVYADPTNASIEGDIERITLNDRGDIWSGGVIVVGGQDVIIPRNMLIDLPANRLTLQQLFIPTPGNPMSGAPPECIAAGETGLARFDACNPTGLGAEVRVAANRLDTGAVIAGDVFIQKPLAGITGEVTYINYDEGLIRVNGLLNNPDTGIMVRLNDPTGRHTVQQGLGCLPGNTVNCSADPRFTIDPDNYVNTFTSGYPYCIPSTVTRTFTDILGLGVTTAQSSPSGTGDVLCPDTNRSINGGQPVDDSRRFAPIQVGDEFRARGNYETVNGVSFFSAHASEVLRSLSTKPLSTQPDYLFVDVASIEAPGFQNQRIESLFGGFTTRAPADVVIWSLHRDPLTNQAHEFPLATTLGCDAAAGVGACTAKGILPSTGADIFSITHIIDFRFLPTERLLDPCAHFRADSRFFALNICPGGGTFAEQFSMLSPVPREIRAKTGHKLANPGLISLDIRGNQAPNGEYTFPLGVGLGGILIPDFKAIDLNLAFTPFIFEGIPWNLDRRLSPGGCIGPCESTPQPLSPFPASGLDPRIQALTPTGPYFDPNFTRGILTVANNRVLSFVTEVSPGVFNFDGNNTLLSLSSPVSKKWLIDFDGDENTDMTIFRDGVWFVRPSSGAAPFAVGWGSPTDIPVPGDYDGDNKTDIAVYRSGLWFIIPSTAPAAPFAVGWGGDPTDKPVPGDYDGDGKTDPAVYRGSSGVWFVVPSATPAAPFAVGWGGDPADKPVPGDYDGDGKIDPAVYREGLWLVKVSSGIAPFTLGWGGDPTDKPVPGDYDGDQKADIAVYRASSGIWFIVPSATPGVPSAVGWGGDGTDEPVPGDYDADGGTDVAVYRTGSGAWFVRPSSGATPFAVGWGGGPTDTPVTTLIP